jgi:hypothetical protein
VFAFQVRGDGVGAGVAPGVVQGLAQLENLRLDLG